jgi:5-methyltetrahydrofolate--homocysteine methyltransferase
VVNALPAVVALHGATKLPLWVKPNAGLPDLEDGRPVYRQTPEEFAQSVPTLIEAGANVIGGCCGTGPEHIRRVAGIVESRRRTNRRNKA